AVGIAYGLAYSILRLSLSDNLPQDDTTSNVLTQTLALGYVPRQPPLYEWLLWLVQQLTGPTLSSFLLIKYGLLTSTVAFLYLAPTRIFRERAFAILAGLSPFLLFQFAWNLHEGVTHWCSPVRLRRASGPSCGSRRIDARATISCSG